MIEDRWQRRIRGIPRSFRELERSLQLLGSMKELGWQRSVRSGTPMDDAGSAVPWITYPAIAWLEPKVDQRHRVFEFGSGASTLWFADRTEEVHSVEHDASWALGVSQKGGPNVTVKHVPSSDEAGEVVRPSEYAKTICEESQQFHIILIDGMDRNGCASTAAKGVAEDGIIVFDNSHRESYRPGINHLRALGFWEIDFYGFPPGYGTLGATSVFGRAQNQWLRPDCPLEDTGW